MVTDTWRFPTLPGTDLSVAELDGDITFWRPSASRRQTTTSPALLLLLRTAIARLREAEDPEKKWGNDEGSPSLSYATIVKDPLVGTDALLDVLIWSRDVGLVPQCMIAVTVQVSPKFCGPNCWLSAWLFRTWPGVRVKTADVNVNPVVPDPSVPSISTWAKMVVALFGFTSPNLNVCNPPVLESDKRCLKRNWLNTGSLAPVIT